jgi:paraquat-inducible protein A
LKAGDSVRLQRAWALVVTGLLLYPAANLIPVMTITITGNVQALTVFGGVLELVDAGVWPAAVLVFFASIVVPFAKLGSLFWLLQLHGSSRLCLARTRVFRLIRTIGTWSMVDLFLLSVLVAVGQLGILASVQAEPGALFFAAVLVATLLAAEEYKPRMIWSSNNSAS